MTTFTFKVFKLLSNRTKKTCMALTKCKSVTQGYRVLEYKTAKNTEDT